jgi:uncharacterized protein (DUF2164 family)
MEPRTFLQNIVMPYLDEFVAQGFEIICQQFLANQYRDTIQEIGRYWYNDRIQKADVCVEKQHETVFVLSNNLYQAVVITFEKTAVVPSTVIQKIPPSVMCVLNH